MTQDKLRSNSDVSSSTAIWLILLIVVALYIVSESPGSYITEVSLLLMIISLAPAYYYLHTNGVGRQVEILPFSPLLPILVTSLQMRRC